MIKLPPDKLVLKIRLSKILKNRRDVEKLFDVIDRTNKIVIYAYQFLRCWILHKYKNKQNIPKITTDIVHMCFRVLVNDSKGPRGVTTKSLILI